MSEEKIIYEPHPVTPERKKELRQQGYKIIDARFNPNPEPAKPVKSELTEEEKAAAEAKKAADKAEKDAAKKAAAEAKKGK